MAYSFGEWLRDARRSSIDPTTGKPFTQERLAELLHISQAKVAQWERGEIRTILPEDGVPLASILNRPVSEIIEAIGWPVNLTLTAAERRAAAAVRRLEAVPAVQEAALVGLEAMPAALLPRPPRLPRVRRRRAVEG